MSTSGRHGHPPDSPPLGLYSAAVAGGKLKLRGPAKTPEDLEAGILANRGELIRLIEEDAIVDELEAFELAREFFGGESGEEEGAA